MGWPTTGLARIDEGHTFMGPAHRLPARELTIITGMSLAFFVALPALGWGSLSGLLANRARLVAFAVVGVAAAASLFTGINLAGCARADARDRWILIPFGLIALLIAFVPAFDDRRELTTIDGEATRYVGLTLMVAGAIFRVGPMFLLGRRFTWPLATQEAHALLTSGFYRFVRHPSYLGGFIGGVGWALVFRSGLGLILVALLVPAILRVVRVEESLLEREFGDEYRAYRRRTSRLIPYIY